MNGKAPAMQFDEALGDGKTKARTRFLALLRIRAATERGEHKRDFILRNAGACIAYGKISAALRRPTDRDIDTFGFTFRTIASLSTDVEAGFDETNPAQYEMLNIRYLILPSERQPSVPATKVETRTIGLIAGDDRRKASAAAGAAVHPESVIATSDTRPAIESPLI